MASSLSRPVTTVQIKPRRPFSHLVPGLALCIAVTIVATLLERAEEAAFGRAWLEALVLAILVGTAIRTAWTPGARWFPGITFSAKTLLEV
ncbi:MAG: putative sulfate exporter family transporter, partial [Janthinobacterium lividum]